MRRELGCQQLRQCGTRGLGPEGLGRVPMSDLSHVEQMIDQRERNAVEKAARYESMRQEVERISITGSATAARPAARVPPAAAVWSAFAAGWG